MCIVIAGLFLGMQIFFILLLVILLVAGVNVMPFEMASLPLEIKTDTDYLRSLAWMEKKEDTDVIDRSGLRSGRSNERTEITGALVMIFEEPDGNVFTKENLELMKGIENELFDEDEYKSDFCAVNYDGHCAEPASVLRYFDGSMQDIDPIFYDPTFSNIVNVLNTAYSHPDTARNFEQYIGKESKVDSTEATSEVTKMEIYFGQPLRGYANSSDEEEEQFEKIAVYTYDTMYKPLDRYYSNGVGKMGFYYYNDHLVSKIIIQQVILDLSLAMIGFAFLFIIVSIQTRSLWVTCWALFSVLSSFFISIIIYRFIFDYRYVGIFHVLAIFIILGIGADDVFVFFDTWRLSANYKFKSMAHRMSYVYRRASLAMLFTSVTTATAFIVSAASPFLAVSSFGIFAGLLVLVNYLSVISFFPTVVLTYHSWFDKFKCCCCCVRSTEQEAGKSFMVRFFGGKFFRFITNKFIRVAILVLFLGIIIFFVVFAAKVKVDKEEVNKQN